MFPVEYVLIHKHTCTYVAYVAYVAYVHVHVCVCMCVYTYVHISKCAYVTWNTFYSKRTHSIVGEHILPQTKWRVIHGSTDIDVWISAVVKPRTCHTQLPYHRDIDM